MMSADMDCCCPCCICCAMIFSPLSQPRWVSDDVFRVLLQGTASSLHGRCVVWLAHLVRHIFGVDEVASPINYKHCSLEELPLLEPDAVGQAELDFPVGRKGLVYDPFGGLPICLRVRQVCADSVEAHS